MELVYLSISEGTLDSGVNKKVLQQVHQLRMLGINATLTLIGPPQIIGEIHPDFVKIISLPSMSKQGFLDRVRCAIDINRTFNHLLHSLDENCILYMRISYPLFLFHFSDIFFRDRKPILITEHQSLEIDEHLLNKRYLPAIIEFMFGGMLRRRAAGIVGVTNEITCYEVKRSGMPKKPHFTLGNGVDVFGLPLRKTPYFDGRELCLICIADINIWHGIDRLIQGMAEYDGDCVIHLHIFGGGSGKEQLISLTRKLQLENRVYFHEFISGKKLDHWFDKAHIAVGSLGIHRIPLQEAATIKSREYCARGIPFITAYSDPDFPQDFPYLYQFPADESSIPILSVLKFADTIYCKPSHSSQMRTFACDNLDWSVKMNQLAGFLKILNAHNSNG